jgi:Domain of unknown function (DUF4416)
MGRPGKPVPVKLFTGILCAKPELLEKLQLVLVSHFGDIDFQSNRFKFSLTDYYDYEMGSRIGRWFWSFERLIDPGDLPDIKRTTNSIEDDFTQDGNRMINLDPGYLDFHKLILASVKDRAQKIYLSKGIYADPTLYYLKGKFHSYDWSLPDFRTDEYYALFSDIRTRYKNALKMMEI